MKKLLVIVVLGLLLSPNAYADDHIITIKCKYDDPGLSFLKPIYVINLETKKVKVGATSMYVLNYSDNEILLGKANAALSEKMKIDRITGRYQKEQIFYGTSEEEKKVVNGSGICQKVEKAF
jgi:hypothetical protein